MKRMVQKSDKRFIMIRGSLFVLLLIGFSIDTIAQVSETASASATIVTPIAISKAADMNFGNIAAGSSSGLVILTPTGSRSLSGGITLPSLAGTVTAASFTVTGAPGFAYSITLPVTPLNITSGNNNMIVNVFESNPVTTGMLDSSGLQILNVGATLSVGASQPAGTYHSTDQFTVTVNYN